MLSPLESIRSVRRLPAETHRILAAAGINQLGSVIEGFLVVYLVHAGFTPGAAAAASGMFAIGTLIGAPVGAWATGRLEPRKAMTVALTLTGTLVAATPFAAGTHSVAGVCALGLLTGATTQAFRPPSSEALSRAVSASGDSVLSFSAFRVAMNAGALLAPVLAAAAIARGWWNLLFALDAATCAAAAVLIATGSFSSASAHADEESATTGSPLRALRGLFTPMRALYLLAMATSGIVYCQTFSTLPLQLEAARQPASLYALILSLGALTLVILELPVTTATRHWPVPATVFVGTVIFGCSFGLYSWPAITAVVIAGAVLAIAGTTISAPRLWSHPASSPARIRPAFFAASHAAFGAGMAIGPVVGVAAWQQMGTVWWPVVALVGIVSAVTGGFGTRDERHMPEAEGAQAAA